MKYQNIPTTTADGLSFRSQLEADRWAELSLLEKAGEIQSLQREVTWRLEVNGTLVCKYIADFQYIERGKLIVEDTKSPATNTRLFQLKKKLMKAVHGIDVRVVMRDQVKKIARPKRKIASRPLPKGRKVRG